MLRALDPTLEGAGVWLVVPCYKVKAHILDVIAKTPPWVEGIVCVDDACPEGSGDFSNLEGRGQCGSQVIFCRGLAAGTRFTDRSGTSLATGATRLIVISSTREPLIEHDIEGVLPENGSAEEIRHWPNLGMAVPPVRRTILFLCHH